MKVSVVIPTLNEGERIGGLSGSLKEALYPNNEIIVVDGGSTDETVEVAKREGALVLQETGAVKGPGNARNQGATVAKGEVVCFFDADEKGVNKEFFERAIKHFEDENVVAVLTALEILPSSAFRKWYLAGRFSTFSKLADSVLYGPSFSFTFIRKDIFLELGGFRPSGTGEEDALSLRLREYLSAHPSKRWVYEPEAVRYDGSALTLREYFRQSVWYGRSSVPYFRSSERGLISKLLIAFFPVGYAVCLTSLFLIPFSKWFLLPFFPYFPKLAFIFWDTLRDRKIYRFFTPFVDLAKGYGHLLGLLDYVFRRKVSR